MFQQTYHKQLFVSLNRMPEHPKAAPRNVISMQRHYLLIFIMPYLSSKHNLFFHFQTIGAIFCSATFCPIKLYKCSINIILLHLLATCTVEIRQFSGCWGHMCQILLNCKHLLRCKQNWQSSKLAKSR